MIDDWVQPNPSPRSLISSFLNDDFSPKPFSDPLTEIRTDNIKEENAGPTTQEREIESTDNNNNNNNNCMKEFSGPSLLSTNQRLNSNGGLAERIGARAGFNVPKLNTSRSIVYSGPHLLGQTSEVRSPYLTIPPGLSPTTLLESPVFLCNNMAQPSPTTGKLPFMQSCTVGPNPFLDVSEGFSFNPNFKSQPASFLTEENKDSSAADPPNQGPIQNQQDFNFQTGFTNPKTEPEPESTIDSPPEASTGSLPESDPQDIEPDPKGDGSQAEDGYNWRKYGQKHVKNSEYPRSYYKCTHLNCPVKKKIERSREGHITEIIYKGAHNHPKPPPPRRSGIPFSPPENPNPNPSLIAGFDGQNKNLQDLTTDAAVSVVVPVASQVLPGGGGACTEGQDGVDVLSAVSNEEEKVTQAASYDCDGDDDETESKRRKLEACTVEINAASRAVREPRVVVQTTSEVDILDDGYRWRKYGQKVVKGNPNPRSYYKCTNPGCSVRKHVERASHDLKSVITTYEGKHNHEVPTAKNSGLAGGASSAAPSAAAATMPPNSNTHNRRPSLPQDSFARFNTLSAGGFSYQMGPHGLTGYRMAGIGPANMAGMAVLPPPAAMPVMHGYLGQGLDAARFLMQNGDGAAENPSLPDPVVRVSTNTTNGSSASVYQQMIMNRMNMGPQM